MKNGITDRRTMSGLLSQEEIDQKKLIDEIEDINKTIQLLKRYEKNDSTLIAPVIKSLKQIKRRLTKALNEFTDNLLASVDAINETLTESLYNY